MNEVIETSKNYGKFAVIFLVGCFFVFLSLLMLPFIIFKVRTVANLFNTGAITIFISFTVLWGAREFCLNRFLNKARSLYAIGFLASLVLCVYYSFFKESYLMTLITLIAELCFVIYFVASYFPGGIDGVKSMF